MKKLKVFLIALLLVFLSLLGTIFIGHRIESPNLEITLPSGEKSIAYGENSYGNFGFPIQFWTVCSGFCGNQESINYLYFFIDFIIWLVVTIFIYLFIKKLIKDRNNTNNYNQ